MPVRSKFAWKPADPGGATGREQGCGGLSGGPYLQGTGPDPDSIYFPFLMDLEAGAEALPIRMSSWR
jgi:hypothetical protein